MQQHYPLNRWVLKCKCLSSDAGTGTPEEKKKDIMYYSEVSSLGLKFIFKGVCKPVSHA